jgi:hypothetical protein
MRYKFIILFLLIGFCSKAQVYQIMPQYGYTTFRMNFDSTIQIPTFCGAPKLGSNVTKKGALAFDSCNNRFYFFNPKFQSWDTIKSADASLFVKYTDTSALLLPYLRKADTSSLSSRIDLKQNLVSLTTTGISGNATFNQTTGALNIPNYSTDTSSLSQRINERVKYTDTSAMLSPYFEAIDTVNLRRVTSVGLTMPSAFTVTNSPITTSGIIGVTGAGTASQYVRGDGVLGDFPTATTGGGASVSYYLNGSVNKGTFGGNTYYEMSRTAIIGAGTDFTRTNAQGDGYIAQFITDTITNLLIPVGNWNLEFYFNASSGGGTPSFYVELYKYDGTNFTLISSNSTSPELIAFGTTINPYFSALAVPETILSGTDRLALRIYVNTSGRSITLHTENSHLCQVITTFTTGLTAINGLTKQVQYLGVGTSGTDFNISSATDTHTFNLPTASSTNRGALSSADWTTFNGKVSPSDTANKWITNVFRKTASDSVFFVRGGNNNFAFRDSTGGGGNIYTTDGSLTSARTLTLNSQPLTILGSQPNRFHANGNITFGPISSGGVPFSDSTYKLSLVSSTGNHLRLKRNSGTGSDLQFFFGGSNNTMNINTTEILQIGSTGNVATFGAGSGSRTIIGTNTSDALTQVIIGYGIFTGGFSSSAILDVRSTTQGFLQPRMTTTQMNAISTPAIGLSVFNTTDSSVYIRRGTGAGWQQVANEIFATASLNFPSTNAQNSSDLTITLTGAVDGDAVSLGVPNAAVNANSCYTAWVSAANTVTVRFNNYSSGAIDPAQATFKVTIIK